MNLLVNVDNNWGIGRDGELLVTLKGDMTRFKNMTTGKVIVYGRKTLRTFPSGKPLINRTNIIMTKNKDYFCENAIIIHSVDALLEELKNYPVEDIFIVGGASIYELLLPYVKFAYVTKYNGHDNADKYFPNLDVMDTWKLIETSSVQHEDDFFYTYNLYKNESLSLI